MDTPKPYDEEKSKDLEMEAREILSDMHKADEPEEEIKEKVYVTECEKCGQFLGMECEGLTYDEREKYGCGFKAIKYKNKLHCPHCLVSALWDDGKQEVKMDKELVVREAIVMPAVSKEKAVEAFRAYQDLAKEIMTPDDVQKIQGKDFKKKSFWRKCQRFFNLSLEKIEERREDNNGVISYHLTYRATAPNLTFVDGCGSCSTNEKGLLKTEHNTRAIAETRAKNRAISDLVAFGEVSYEEVAGNIEENEQREHQEEEPRETRTVKYISDKQAKRLYAITRNLNVSNEVVKAYLQEKYHIDHSKEITMDIYDDVVKWVEDYGAKNQPPKE